jgi:hypothetical protein
VRGASKISSLTWAFAIHSLLVANPLSQPGLSSEYPGPYLIPRSSFPAPRSSLPAPRSPLPVPPSPLPAPPSSLSISILASPARLLSILPFHVHPA